MNIPRVNADYDKDLVEQRNNVLKEELKKYIPVYMIPKKIKFLEKLPMNNNGKVDRKELKRILENK